jgi:hypothetical protein
MAPSVTPTIETLGIYTVQMSHPQGEISINRLHYKMIMVVRKTVGVTKSVEAFSHLSQNEKKPAPITIILKNAHPGLSPRCYMVRSAAVLP